MDACLHHVSTHLRAVCLTVSLLSAWGARGQRLGHGDATYFPGDNASPEDKSDAVQGLRYFATGTSSIVPQQVVVYPGPILSSGNIIVPAQVGQPAAIQVSGYGIQPTQVLPPLAYGSGQLPTHAYGSMQQTSVLYGSTHNLEQGGGVQPKGGGIIPQNGGDMQQAGGILQHGSGVLHPVGGVLSQGGAIFPQTGVLQVSFPRNQPISNFMNAALPTPYPSTQPTTAPSLPYVVTQPITPSTPYGTQPPHAIYQDGVKPLSPGFLLPTPSSVPHTASSQLHNDHSHAADIDLTYDSLGSPSSSHGDSYNNAHNLVSQTSSGGKVTSPPPMKATTYGPPKPLHSLYVRHRRPNHMIDAVHYHPVHKGIISPYYHYHHPHGMHRHLHSTVVLKPQTYQLPSLHKHAAAIYEQQQQLYHTPQSIYFPPATRPIYHQQSLHSSYAPTHGYSFVDKSYMNNAHEHDIKSGEAMMHSQENTASSDYSTIVGTFYEDSSRPQQAANKAPVIVYNGVRLPVRVYQKPEHAEKYLPPVQYYPSHHIDRADSVEPSAGGFAKLEGHLSATLAPFQSNWMPINAPEGVVPVKAYEMEAPDLSRDRGNHHVLPQQEGEGKKDEVSSLTMDHPVEKYFRPRPLDKTREGEFYKGNSEEVVSAIVMVKQE